MCGTALDFFRFLCVLLEPTNALPVRVMPHAIGIDGAVLTGAKPHFHRLIVCAIEALGSDSFEW